MVPGCAAGYGNPHPIDHAPLFYGAAEPLHLAGLGAIGSLKMAIVIAMILAAVGMYLYARLLLDGPFALAASAAYTDAPYHLLDLYVRKAFSSSRCSLSCPSCCCRSTAGHAAALWRSADHRHLHGGHVHGAHHHDDDGAGAAAAAR